jgi:hypothetical protein
MKQCLFSNRARSVSLFSALVVFVAGASASSALASTTTPATSCSTPSLSQPFLSAGDSNWYTMAPGESPDNLAGEGWTLRGGASIELATLADGTTGSVLDLPAGSSAVSPAMCVDGSYPIARMVTRTLGAAPSNATTFYTSVVGASKLSGGMPVLGKPTWAVSPPDNVAPGAAGAEQVQFTFVAGAKAADLQIYNFWVDPRMCR